MTRVLSKSRFKLGLECPNKLYFTARKEYVNTRDSDAFLASLAKGGFQVEALARYNYPDGIFIDRKGKSYEQLAEETRRLLEAGNVVLFEAAFLYEGLFVHIDILVKEGNRIRLIEVKAKSYDGKGFLGERGDITAKWEPYLFDVAFQKYVVSLCFPKWKVEAFLYMADKEKEATVDGLNQMFRWKGDRELEIRSDNQGIGEPILREVPVNDIVDAIISGEHSSSLEGYPFDAAVEMLKNIYGESRFPEWEIKYSACRKCEFKATAKEEAEGKKSGFKHCFSTLQDWGEEDFQRSNIFEIYNFRSKKREELISEGRFFMEQLYEEDFMGKDGMSDLGQRQWLQVSKAAAHDFTPDVKTDELLTELQNWTFPLHFIDFETSAAALPFLAGNQPYQDVAFQFSHHIFHEDGRIEHATEFIESRPGVDPNIAFVRSLKSALENDRGSIFRYSNHENKILVNLIPALNRSTETDKGELIDFILKITKKEKEWEGTRNMIDLCDIVKKYYYNPYTKGSNSLKAVLPAILRSSKLLNAKYSRPLAEINVTSLNFPLSHVWLNNGVNDPYKQLPELFEGMTALERDENISDLEDIREGGAALTAYAMLQYTDMPEHEREEIVTGLKKYCELDTLAMVMLYEHLREVCGVL